MWLTLMIKKGKIDGAGGGVAAAVIDWLIRTRRRLRR